jgi:hypothetical protein
MAHDGSLPVVTFDNTNPLADKNLRTVRPHHQSPIDNTKSGVVNLGSDTTNGTTGATGDYSTIGGGNQNDATNTGATVPGGTGNTASGVNSHAVGAGTTASGTGAHSEGVGSIASGQAAHAQGFGAIASRLGQHADTAFSSAGLFQHGSLTYGVAGVASGDSGELLDALGTPFVLEENKTYAIKVRFLAAQIGAGKGGAYVVYDLLVHTDGAGNAVIDASNLTLNLGVNNALTVNSTNSPPELHLVFVNSDVALSANAGATIDWTEAPNT